MEDSTNKPLNTPKPLLCLMSQEHINPLWTTSSGLLRYPTTMTSRMSTFLCSTSTRFITWLCFSSAHSLCLRICSTTGHTFHYMFHFLLAFPIFRAYTLLQLQNCHFPSGPAPNISQAVNAALALVTYVHIFERHCPLKYTTHSSHAISRSKLWNFGSAPIDLLLREHLLRICTRFHFS